MRAFTPCRSNANCPSRSTPKASAICRRAFSSPSTARTSLTASRILARRFSSAARSGPGAGPARRPTRCTRAAISGPRTCPAFVTPCSSILRPWKRSACACCRCTPPPSSCPSISLTTPFCTRVRWGFSACPTIPGPRVKRTSSTPRRTSTATSSPSWPSPRSPAWSCAPQRKNGSGRRCWTAPFWSTRARFCACGATAAFGRPSTG